MVDAIISAVVEDLTSLTVSSIEEEVKLVTRVDDEVKKLVSNFKSIQALLDDAEEQQLKDASVKNWLFNLKSVSYDMDDVLDQWKTWIHTSQLHHQHHSADRITRKHKVFCIFRCNCISLPHFIGGRIKEIHEMLENIATDKVRHQLNSTIISDKHIERHVTTSFVETQKVRGRDVEKDQVKRKILEAKSKPYIISLVGLGGIGKTTLAKLIYNDSKILTHFEKMIWVSLSGHFDVWSAAKAILESLGSSSSIRDLGEFFNVQMEIRAVLNKKRFLVVLDDMWLHTPSRWRQFVGSFESGLSGSTILTTTRDVEVAQHMGCYYPETIHKVGFLTSEECWSIISQVTLVKGDGQGLESIGRKIADKCNGLPLVANTIGGVLLFKKSENEWWRVLERKEWEGNDVLAPLKISYYDLPSSLKQCFKYCAIFPKNSWNKKSRLIRMWMAQGYLRGEEKDEDLEIVGETYFNNLIARSLLQISFSKNENRRFIRTRMTQDFLRGKEKKEDLEITTKTRFHNWMSRSLLPSLSSDFDDDWFIMHDKVIHLARSFAKDECLRIDYSYGLFYNENSSRSDANARHLTVVIKKADSFPVHIYGLNKLRSLIIQSTGYESSLAVDAIKDIFHYLTSLRTLDLSKCGIKEVPSSISRLVHLRWLDLSENKNLEQLPKSLCDCYNLQSLILFCCGALVELPQEIGKLSNLMFLDIRSCFKIKHLPKGIGNLLCLKELRDFIVGVYENQTSCIVEMEKLDNLRGSLMIRGLGNVRKIEDARKAQLIKKKNVTDLGLIFDGDDVQEDEEELLDALEPPLSLEILRLKEYKGKTFPSWMMKLNLLKNLEISNCFCCEELPPLGKLSCLEELYLTNMRVKRVGVEFMGIEKEKDSWTSFPKLKILLFDGFLEWEEWDDVDEWLTERINNKTITVMSSLQELSIYNCPELKTLPYHILSPPITPELQRLDINHGCHCLQQIQEDRLSHISHHRFPNQRQAEQEEKEEGEEDCEETWRVLMASSSQHCHHFTSSEEEKGEGEED